MSRLPAPQAEPAPAEVGPRRAGPDPASAYLARLAPGSRRAMRGALRTIAGLLVPGLEEAPDPASFPWEKVRAEHAKAVRSKLAERYRFSTANKMLSALRGVLREAWELGLMETDAYHRAAAVRAVKGERAEQAAGRALSRHELRALLAACLEPTAPREGEPPALAEKGRRDAALIALGYGCGLRRSELAALRVEEVDLARRQLRLKGKGNKERVVPVPPGALEALADYLRLVRLPGLRGTEGIASEDAGTHSDAAIYKASPLFVQARRGGSLDHAAPALTDQAVYHVLRERAREAGVEAFSPHDLRCSYVGDLLDEGADLSVAQKLAGHASPTTTASYDRRGERAKARAAARLDVPYDHDPEGGDGA